MLSPGVRNASRKQPGRSAALRYQAPRSAPAIFQKNETFRRSMQPRAMPVTSRWAVSVRFDSAGTYGRIVTRPWQRVGFGSYTRAYFPRPKNRSFWSSLALSRIDLSIPTWASARLTASRAAILSAQDLTFGYFVGSIASSSKLRNHGHAAMSAIVYSVPAT